MAEPDGALTDRVMVLVDYNSANPFTIRTFNMGSLTFPHADPADLVHIRQAPPGFDQVLAYAATTFSTAVANSAWVPLFPRLLRLARARVCAWKAADPNLDDALSAFHVVKAIRSNTEPSRDGSLPLVAHDFVMDVRQRLHAVVGQPLYDDHGKKGMTFPQVFAFNYWMQQGFKELGRRLGRLMPVFRVHRAHVRLDCKTLLAMFCALAPPTHEPTRLLQEAKRAHVAAKKAGGHGHTNPEDYALLSIERPKALKKKDCATAAAWAQHKEALSRAKAAIDAIRESSVFVAQQARYNAFVALEVATVRSFFQAKCKAKKNWDMDASIVTDGVSVSLQFSRTVRRKAGGSKEMKALKRKTGAAAVSRGDEDGAVSVDYDKELSTYLEGTNVCILGLDPGRCNLATVTYLLRRLCDGDLREYSSTWKLRRTDYRHKSLIVMQDLLQRDRADKAGLLAERSSLGQVDAALNTLNSAHMVSYLVAYSAVQERCPSQTGA